MAITAATFANPSEDPAQPTIAEAGDWSLAFTHIDQWAIDATRGGDRLEMRVQHSATAEDVAWYVAQQIDWYDNPPAPPEPEPEPEPEG